MKSEENGINLVNQSEIEEVSLIVLSRVRELIFGEHSSIFTGSGFDFSGLREWQPGDRQSLIDWAHSTHTGFSPLIVREYVEERSVDVLIVADASLSVRCGVNGTTVGNIISRVIATIGLSAVVFQDRVGLAIFGGKKDYFLETPKGGKNHVFNILDLYQNAHNYLEELKDEDFAEVILGSLRRTSLVVVISDFLFSDANTVIKELKNLNNNHDVFLVMVDASFIFRLPPVSVGWIECLDVETGHKLLFSRSEFLGMVDRVSNYQEKIKDLAEKEGFEVLKVGNNRDEFQNAIIDFFFERRVRIK